jgi:membrane associated rhomboid family serine protease
MHFSLMHILFNLLWWWYLGGAVEKRLGSGKLIVITVISALLSGYVQHKFSGPWFGGLSGGLCADGLCLAARRARSAKRHLSATRFNNLCVNMVNCRMV